MVLRSASSRPVVQLARPALSAAPVMASFIGVAPSRPSEAMAWTPSAAVAAPTKAIGRNWPIAVKPNAVIPTTIAKVAPALTPRMPGSASGLRVRPCISAPERPSAAPTAKPRTVRSKRTCTIACSGWPGSHTAAGGTARAPTSRERTPAPASTATAIAALTGRTGRRRGSPPRGPAASTRVSASGHGRASRSSAVASVVGACDGKAKEGDMAEPWRPTTTQPAWRAARSRPWDRETRPQPSMALTTCGRKSLTITGIDSGVGFVDAMAFCLSVSAYQ